MWGCVLDFQNFFDNNDGKEEEEDDRDHDEDNNEEEENNDNDHKAGDEDEDEEDGDVEEKESRHAARIISSQKISGLCGLKHHMVEMSPMRDDKDYDRKGKIELFRLLEGRVLQ